MLPANSVSGARVQHGKRVSGVGGRVARPYALRVRAATARDMSAQVKDIRSKMEQDEQLRVLMAGFRGTNLDAADFADKNVKMNLVEMTMDETEQLPLAYDPEAIAFYWDRRPVSVVTRITQLSGIGGTFIAKLIWDLANNKLRETEVERAVDLRNILTSLGPAYIKLGQALSIRPDLLSPAAMNELQKLCDKVPSFDNEVAMQLIETELGRPWYEVYAELTPEPIAAASLGQVYKGKLKTGETVAVKVQRPYVLETVTIDLYIIRKFGMFVKRFPQITTDVVALLDEWASRFFEELDYVHEGQNATKFAAQMKDDLPQVVVPQTYFEYTSRRVLTTEWLEGEKLSQSQADDVGTLVNIGVICYLKQLLDTGFFHADPHPGNLIRTPDGRLAILDFGLMTTVDDNIKYGMIEAISHLIHRDYDAIGKDFVTLDFIPKNTDLRPILPVLAKVFDQALEGGGAKNINFQELAADLAQITFDYPFRIPPYFALIIRAIGVLEGIALVGNPDFALVDEAFPYIARRLLTDDAPRLRESLRYMVYGKEGVFDADRLIDLLNAFEDFGSASRSARGDMADELAAAEQLRAQQRMANPFATAFGLSGGSASQQPTAPQLPFPFPLPFPPLLTPFPMPVPSGMAALGAVPLELPGAQLALAGPVSAGGNGTQVREALSFLFAPEGAFFRDFLMDEIVKSIDALSREQLYALVMQLGLQNTRIPLLLPGSSLRGLPLAPQITEEDRKVVENVSKLVRYLLGGSGPAASNVARMQNTSVMVGELLPVLPPVAMELVPELGRRLASRITARFLREVYL